MDDEESTTDQHQRASRWQRLVLRVVFWLGCALSLVAGALAFVVVNAVAIVDQNLDRLLPLASELLQRPLSIAAVRGTVFPRVSITIDGLELGSRTQREPLLLLGSIELGFRTDLLLWSRGRELVTDVIHIDGGLARVVRDHNGDFEFLDVLARLPPLNPEDIQGAVLGDVRVDGVHVTYIDEPAMRVVPLARVHLETDGVGLGRPFLASLSAQWSGPNTPITLEAVADEVPTDLVLWPLPSSSFNLTTGNIPLSDVADVASTSLPFVAGAVSVAASVQVQPEQPWALHVALDGEATSLPVTSGTGARIERQPVTRPLRVHADIAHDLEHERTTLQQACVEVIGVSGCARAAINGGEVKDVEAHVDVEQLARLGLLVPPLLTTSPGAFVLAGAGRGDVLFDGRVFSATLTLPRARIEIGEALRKPAGAPLVVEAEGCHGGACGTLNATLSFALQHGTIIAGTLFVPEAAGADVVLDLRSNAVALGEASAISPLINDVFGTTQRGVLQAHAVGHISSRRTAFDIDIDLSALDLRYANTAARGGAHLHFDVDTDHDGLALGVVADASDVELTTIDEHGAVVVSKRQRLLCLVSANVRELGGRGALGQAMSGMDHDGVVFDGDHLAPRWQTIMAGLAGSAAIRVSSLDIANVPLQQVQLDVSLRQGRLSMVDSAVKVLGGLVHLKKSTVDVSVAPVHWALDVQARGLSARTVLAPIRRFTGAISGTFDASASLSARGLSVAPLLQSLSGPLSVTTHGVHFARLDLVSSWIDRFWAELDRLPYIDHEAVAVQREVPLSASISDTTWSVRFVRDQFRFSEPLVFDTAVGALRLVGAAGFDGSIDFDARLLLAHPWLDNLEIVDEDDPLALRAHVGGTWTAAQWRTDNFDVLRKAAIARTRRAIVDVATIVRDQAQTIQDDAMKMVDRAHETADGLTGKATARDGSASTSPTPTTPP